MAYTVLARKYRSRTFDDLVGQEAIATTLKNAVAGGRVHHGYLFTGTRGVGKTSSARVLAKALNCMAVDAPTPTPCCDCESCRMIAEGEDIDVIEIDGASHTGVENIRELRDNTAYRPARARFKIYIIDEVHMLSTSAFNALLKTLEEPPDHVKFILATTEIQKVPATIVSRCQRFDFKSISVDAIGGHLKHVLEAERVPVDEAVVRRIARLANGSMRDGLSLLDQLLSFGGGKLDPAVLEEVLPPAHDEVVTELMDHVADGDAGAALECVERSLSSGQTIERFCELTVEHLRTLMVMHVCGAETDLVDLPAPVRERLAVQAGRFDAPTYVYLVSLMEEVRRAVKSSLASRALVDAAVVRLAMAEHFSSIETLLEQLDDGAAEGATRGAVQVGTAAAGPKKKADSAGPRRVRVSAEGAVAAKTDAGGARGGARSSEGRPSSVPFVRSVSRASSASAASPEAPAAKRLRGVGSAEESRVRADPGIRSAIDLFDGTLMSVHRREPAPADSAGSQGERPVGAEPAEAAPAGGVD